MSTNVETLIESDAHLVPLEPNEKRPSFGWVKWPEIRAMLSDFENADVGLIPASLDMVVVDIDECPHNITSCCMKCLFWFLEQHPTEAVYSSTRAQKYHLYYKTEPEELFGYYHFNCRGVTGQVIYGSYVRIQPYIDLLVRDLSRIPSEDIDLPRVSKSQAQLKSNESGPPPSLNSTVTPLVSELPQYLTVDQALSIASRVRVGQRDSMMFEITRRVAYGIEMKASSYAEKEHRVIEFCWRVARQFPTMTGMDDNPDYVGKTIAKWTWKRYGRKARPNRSIGGLKSTANRKAKILNRDLAVHEFAKTGASNKAIMRQFSLSNSTMVKSAIRRAEEYLSKETHYYVQ